MAEEDDSSKTEDPTGKKLSKAHDKGQVAVSQEIKNWVVIFGGTMVLMGIAPSLASRVTDIATKFIQSPHAIQVDFEHLRFTLADAALQAGLALSPVFALLVFAAVAASLAQVGFMWATEKLKADPSKISPLKGAKRLFSAKAMVEFLKGIIKLTVVAVVAFGLAIPMLNDVTLFPTYPLAAFLDRLQMVSIVLALGTLGVMTIIAILDYAYQKHSFTKDMKMSKQEVKDEHKQSEGDPMIKRKIAQLRVERARQRMMAAVPQADVVITNPTHYSVALKYSMGDMAAPRLIAKGVDEVAFRIRTVAEENDVPIVENPPLTRALYAAVELDEEIPQEHYKAVAEVIGYVMRLRGELPQAETPPEGG